MGLLFISNHLAAISNETSSAPFQTFTTAQNDGFTGLANTLSGLSDSAHIEEVSKCNALIQQLSEQGKYTEALPYALKVIQITQEDLGPNHLEVAAALNNAAWVMQAQGDYIGARKDFECALKITEQSLGAEHPNVAYALNNLAALSYFEGDFDVALPLYQRAKIITEKAYGPEHPNVAIILKSIAGVLDAQGKKDDALILYEQALKINQKSLPPDSLDLASSLNDLACALQAKERFAEAAQLLEQTLKIREKSLGENHPDIAESLNNLAMLYRDQNEYAAATPLLDRALKICQFSLGPEHLDVANVLNNQGEIAWLKHDQVAASQDFLQAAHIVDLHTQRLLPSLSFAEQHAFIDTRIPSEISRLLVSCRQGSALSAAYGFIFHWKGLLIEALRRQSAINKLAANQAISPLVENLQKVRGLIASWYLEAGQIPYEQWKQKNDSLSRQKESIERELAEAVKTDVLKDDFAAASISQLRNCLNPGEALIDIYLYHYTDPNGIADERYAAIILGSDASDQTPILVDLGSANLIRSSVQTWLASIKDQTNSQPNWQAITSILWQPLAQKLPAKTTHLWICPDGVLSRLPWQFLPGTTNLDIVQVDSVRELFNLRNYSPVMVAENAVAQSRLLLVGGIDFNSTKQFTEQPEKLVRQPFNLSPLPGTANELTAIKQIAQKEQFVIEELTGDQATKHALVAALPGATFSHLATHGFFFNQEIINKIKEKVQVEKQRAEARSIIITPREIKEEGITKRNPLVESGIALAGANLKASTGDENPGLLTAEELVGMDLNKCRLIALSACDTGRGEEIAGQGVMGLRASIMASGVKSILMSLWKVPDEPTVKLMTAFYRNLWERKLPATQALKEAQIDTSKTYPISWCWAGWVLIGQGW